MRADRIVIAAAKAYGVDPNDVLGPRRAYPGDVRSARIAAVTALRRYRRMSYPEIASVFGRSFHSSVQSWDRAFTDELSADAREDMVARMDRALSEEHPHGR